MTATATPRTSWKQTDVIALANAFNEGGFKAAQAAFPGRDVEAKVTALGLVKLGAHDHNLIGAFFVDVQKCAYPALVARAAIKRLREIAKD